MLSDSSQQTSPAAVSNMPSHVRLVPELWYEIFKDLDGKSPQVSRKQINTQISNILKTMELPSGEIDADIECYLKYFDNLKKSLRYLEESIPQRSHFVSFFEKYHSPAPNWSHGLRVKTYFAYNAFLYSNKKIDPTVDTVFSNRTYISTDADRIHLNGETRVSFEARILPINEADALATYEMSPKMLKVSGGTAVLKSEVGGEIDRVKYRFDGAYLKISNPEDQALEHTPAVYLHEIRNVDLIEDHRPSENFLQWSFLPSGDGALAFGLTPASSDFRPWFKAAVEINTTLNIELVSRPDLVDFGANNHDNTETAKQRMHKAIRGKLLQRLESTRRSEYILATETLVLNAKGETSIDGSGGAK